MNSVSLNVIPADVLTHNMFPHLNAKDLLALSETSKDIKNIFDGFVAEKKYAAVLPSDFNKNQVFNKDITFKLIKKPNTETDVAIDGEVKIKGIPCQLENWRKVTIRKGQTALDVQKQVRKQNEKLKKNALKSNDPNKVIDRLEQGNTVIYFDKLGLDGFIDIKQDVYLTKQPVVKA